jgi:hypothetical protein
LSAGAALDWAAIGRNLRPFGLFSYLEIEKLANSQVFWEQVFEFCALSSQAGLDVNFRHLKFGIPGDW